MAGVPQDEWLVRAVGLAQAHAQVSLGAQPPRAPLARALVDLLDLAMTAPRALRDGFRAVDEAALTREAIARGGRIRDDGRLGWLSPTEGAQDVFDALALQVRSLDEALHDDYASRPPSDPLLFEDFCRIARAPEHGGDRFLIKRIRTRPGLTVAAHHPYVLRALRRHRLLPTQLGDLPIRLYHKPTLAQPTERGTISQPAQTLGAALFEGFALERPAYEEIVTGPFRIDAVTSEDPDGTVVAQVAEASRAGCFALVWPELSVTPQLRERIASALADEEKPPQITVAGSWHEDCAGAVTNSAHVLDGRGTPILRYDKIHPYSNAKGAYENIRRGDCIPVLVTDEAIVAFAICRDFCDASEPLPNLDVDLVLVPSLSDEKALPGHIHNAIGLVGSHRTRSFVVQQALPASPDGLGWVLDVQRLPGSVEELVPVAQNATFAAYERQSSDGRELK